MTKQIINPNFQYGQGDNGESTLKQGVRLPKQSIVARFYNHFELWVKRMREAFEFLEHDDLLKDLRLDVNPKWFLNRVNMMLDILEYFCDNAYCLGAQVYTSSVKSWQWDGDLLDWMRIEIPQLESIAHNFITPEVMIFHLSALEEARIQTRMLESYTSAVLPRDDEGSTSINEKILNRLSSYLYLFENFLRTCHGERIDDTDWSMDANPKFQPLRSDAGSNN